MDIQSADQHKTTVKVSLTQAAEVRHQLDAMIRAIRNGRLAEITSFYSQAIVAYDMMPPLKFTDLNSYRQTAWMDCFITAFQFPVSYEYREDQLFVTDEYAIRTGEVHMSGVLKKNSERVENRLRNTTVLQKMDGEWKIIHEHNSVPIGQDMKALMNLKPELQMH